MSKHGVLVAKEKHDGCKRAVGYMNEDEDYWVNFREKERRIDVDIELKRLTMYTYELPGEFFTC